MPGPTTSAQALQWVREALVARRFLIDPHFRDQCQRRRLTFGVEAFEDQLGRRVILITIM